MHNLKFFLIIIFKSKKYKSNKMTSSENHRHHNQIKRDEDSIFKID